MHQWNLENELGMADFDGDSGEVRVQLPLFVGPFLATSGGVLTVMAWMNPSEPRNGAGVQIRDAEGSFGSALSLDQQGRYSWMVQDRNGKYHGVRSSSRAITNVWSHVAGVFEEHCMSIYINSTLEAKLCDIDGYQIRQTDNNYVEVLIGKYETESHSSFFKGSIGDVRIFERAVSEDEIGFFMAKPLKVKANSARR